MEGNTDHNHLEGQILSNWPKKLHLCLTCLKTFHFSRSLTDHRSREYRLSHRSPSSSLNSLSSSGPVAPSKPSTSLSLLSMVPNNSSTLSGSGYGYKSIPKSGYRAAVSAAVGLDAINDDKLIQSPLLCPYCNGLEVSPAPEPVEYMFFPPAQDQERDSPMVEYNFFPLPPKENVERDDNSVVEYNFFPSENNLEKGSPMVEHSFFPPQEISLERDDQMIEHRFFPGPDEEESSLLGERDDTPMVEYRFFPPYEEKENESEERDSSMVEYMFFPPCGCGGVEGETNQPQGN